MTSSEDHPASEPVGERRGLWLAVGWKLVVAAGAAGVVTVLLLGRGGTGDEPPLGVLLVGGAVILVLTAGALAVIVGRDLSLPTSVLLYAVGYNALIVAAKFVLAPYGLYEVNRTRPLRAFVNVSSPEGVVATAVVVFLLYAGVYAAIFWYMRRRRQLGGLSGLLRWALRWSRRRTLIVVLVGGALLVSAVMSGGMVFLLLLYGGASVGYVSFVFASTVSLLVALALGVAAWLATRAFDSVADRAALIGDATLLVSFFWVGLAFLAVYHVLWAVYVLLLITYWPLRAVVPK